MRGRHAVIGAGLLLLALGPLLWWLSRPVPPPPKELFSFRQVSFADLQGWAADDHGSAVTALLESCKRFTAWPPDRPLGGRGRIAGSARDWHEPCAAAKSLTPGDHSSARAFFEGQFQAVAVSFAGQNDGLFTGYYEPLLRGSRQPQPPYTVPLYAVPKDLIRVNLGHFSDSLKGRRIVGRVKNGRLHPYYGRQKIEAGVLSGQGLELVYVDDAVDAFFLHIQGSGRVALADGGEMRVGYAGRNGRRYFAIGRELIRRGDLDKKTVSMQSIRAWLAANPDQAQTVMDMNPSYIFFRELTGPGPLGAMGVPLTAGRSIAVDRRLLPLGIPVWLQATRPAADASAADLPLQRLFIAQDTGGAIRGGIRGDVFWGHGAEAAAIAGRMKHKGRWFLLLPKAVAQRL